MRFKRLDLNLLVALDILLTERNVSRAADKLCLSQSATSGALARLREYFGDDLLVQVGRKMVLTPRAQALAPKVRAVLMQIDGAIIQPPEFDPATVERTIRILASDYVAIAVLYEAIREIRRKAPKLTIVIDPPQENPAQALSHGDIDLLAMPEVYLAEDHPSERYFEDDYVVVTCAENPLYRDGITREEFFEAPHVSMRFTSHTPSFEAWFLKNSGSERKVAVQAGSFTAVPFLLVGTRNIALLQSRLARVFAAMMPLRVLTSPIDIPPLVEHLQWHAFSEGDDCLNWVRQEILAIRPA
ncbi:MAG: LysR family transcriptional regulator [Rhodobacteraceae bacterium]|nr:LysR family transcriptional regulator [Paracoccaceae bacterium]